METPTWTGTLSNTLIINYFAGLKVRVCDVMVIPTAVAAPSKPKCQRQPIAAITSDGICLHEARASERRESSRRESWPAMERVGTWLAPEMGRE